MIYRCALISRRPGLDEDRFRKHWIEVHGALAAKLPGLGTYRQNHILERLFEAPESPLQAIDGISQLSFDSVGHMEGSDQSPEYAAVKLDIPKFQGAITILVIESDEVVANAGRVDAPAKLLWVSSRRDGVAPKDLRQRWLAARPEPGSELPIAGLRRLVQNFVTDRSHPVSANVPSGDASGAETISEAWFDDLASARAAAGSPAGRQLLHDDPMLVAVGIYLMEEIRII